MTGNIIGEPINKYVQDQISQRQKVHGSGFGEERSLEDINYLNSSTSWVKMVSSVEISSDIEQLDATVSEGKKRIIDLGLDIDKYSGISLAKSAILFNTISQANFKKDNTFSNYTSGSGYNTNSNNLWNTNNSYGLGGLEFGIQPPPGIKSFKVNHLNRGSIRKGEIHIKAYNKVQFEIIELLYLRLGFTMFIEWGNSIFIDNKGVTDRVTNTLTEDFWFNNGSTSENYETLLKKINEKREFYDGNYDGFCGRVVNFNWAFSPDGSYDINIELASLGDVIESLTINNFYFNKPYTKESDNNNTTNIISSFLDTQRVIFDIKDLYKEFGSIKINSNRKIHIQDKLKKIKQGELKEEIDLYEEYSTSCISFAQLSIIEEFNESWWPKGDQANYEYGYFIKFGAFLHFIQQHILPRISNDKKPILNIKNNSNSNFMYCNPMQFAIDPRICFVRNDYLPKFTNKDSTPPKDYDTSQNIKNINKYFNPWLIDLDGQFLGSIMDVYLNFAFIETLLKNLQEKNTGKIRLFTFLQSICEGINKSLGGLNKLEPVIDEDSNSITFIDSALDPSILLNNINESIPTDSTFELYGYNPTNNTSNFVKDFNFQTELSPKFATMLTIGATSVGSVVGEDATAFSKWNTGLKDRYNPEVVEPQTLSDFQKNSGNNVNDFKLKNPEQKKSLNYRERQDYYYDEAKYNTKKRLDNETEYNRSNFAGYLVEIFGGSIMGPNNKTVNISKSQAKYAEFDDPKLVERGYSVIRNNIENIQKQLQQSSGEIQSTIGFIPVRLSLTIDGLSGIKIYNKLIFNTKFLPSNYPNSLDFLVTQVNHELENNNWITKLETISVPKQNKVSIKDILEKEGKAFIIPNGDGKRIPVAELKPSADIYRFIARKESFRAQPYDDANPNKPLTTTSKIEGTLTIGYGTTIIPYSSKTPDIIFNQYLTEPNLTQQQKPENYQPGIVQIGYVVNEVTAFNFLKDYINKSQKIIKSWLKVPLTQNEYDALLSFTYNNGPGSSNKLTFVGLLNKEDYTGAGNSLHLYNKSEGEVNKGLIARRQEELELWMRNNPGNPK